VSKECTVRVEGVYSTCRRSVQYVSKKCTVRVDGVYCTCRRSVQYVSKECTGGSGPFKRPLFRGPFFSPNNSRKLKLIAIHHYSDI
jgi:hypothetical protein